VHCSLFAIRCRAIIGLVPRPAERTQTAPNPLPGLQLPGFSHTSEIYAATGCTVVRATVCHPMCEEQVTERLLSGGGTPVVVATDCDSGLRDETLGRKRFEGHIINKSSKGLARR
jgi:hypothetical protein